MRHYVKRVVTSAKTQLLERLLLRHGAELDAHRRSLREGRADHAETVRDELDLSVDDFASEVGAALLQVSSRTVQGLEDALRRLRAGSYGSCQDCGRSIPLLRLQALPFADRCRDCQQECDPEAPWASLPA